MPAHVGPHSTATRYGTCRPPFGSFSSLVPFRSSAAQHAGCCLRLRRRRPAARTCSHFALRVSCRAHAVSSRILWSVRGAFLVFYGTGASQYAWSFPVGIGTWQQVSIAGCAGSLQPSRPLLQAPARLSTKEGAILVSSGARRGLLVSFRTGNTCRLLGSLRSRATPLMLLPRVPARRAFKVSFGIGCASRCAGCHVLSFRDFWGTGASQKYCRAVS